MRSESAAKVIDARQLEVIELPHKTLPVSEKTGDNTTGLPAPGGWWQRVWRHPTMMPYHRLAALVTIINLSILYAGAFVFSWWTPDRIALDAIGNIVLGNFFVAIIVRQQYVINGLFKIATSAPTHWPLSVRWALGKVYHFGGIHSGCAVAGTVWFGIFTVSLFFSYNSGQSLIGDTTMWLTYSLLALLFSIVLLATPVFRARFHNHFEVAHRFGGWSALVLFWAQNVSLTIDQNSGTPLSATLAESPSFWLLLVITASIALPWMRLRKVPVEISKPSNHAVLVKFDHGVTPFAGSSTPVSRNPLFEWHSFANVPSPNESGFRLTISRAGDWTGQFIDDTPSHVWVKGVPTAGVGNIDKLFKRVVWIATGSGIGPCLPHLLSGEVPAHLVWSTRDPRATYGDALVDEILSVQPNALIWNTQEQGRPDLVQLAYDAWREFDAEAVICIANQKLTYQVCYGMESRGIPAFGAIWDS